MQSHWFTAPASLAHRSQSPLRWSFGRPQWSCPPVDVVVVVCVLVVASCWDLSGLIPSVWASTKLWSSDTSCIRTECCSMALIYRVLISCEVTTRHGGMHLNNDRPSDQPINQPLLIRMSLLVLLDSIPLIGSSLSSLLWRCQLDLPLLWLFDLAQRSLSKVMNRSEQRCQQPF